MPLSYVFHSPKLGLPRPDYTDTPVDLVDLFSQRDAVLDLCAHVDNGALSGRPTSSPSIPGKAGRFYIVLDQPDSPRLDLDWGIGWITVGPDPASKTFAMATAVTGFPVVPAGGGATVIPLSTVVIDFGNNWKIAAPSHYLVPASGVYSISGALLLLYHGSAKITTQGRLDIYQNGIPALSDWQLIQIPEVFFSWKVIGSIYCTKGDKIDMRATNGSPSGSSDLLIQGTAPNTRMSITRIG